MKLSEAIRLGAMMRPQGKYNYMMNGRSCAIGAALEAIGIPVRDRGNDFSRDNEREALEELKRRPEIKEWSALNKKKNTHCPSCEYVDQGNFSGVISHLNNSHDWTRERIAEWVATIELAETVEAAKVEECQLAITK